MRPREDFTAMHDILINGVAGYRTGDGMTAEVVDNLREQGMDLEVGVDVMPVRPEAVPYPQQDAPVEHWRAYAVAHGMTPAKAADTPRADLVAAYPDPDAQRTDYVKLPPAKSANKADWVAWYLSAHPDANPDEVEEMTIRELQADVESGEQ
jgi:hypothetical protein